MERKTHYERIIGGTPEEKEVALQELQVVFEERSEELAEYEIEKSPEDLEILKKIESIIDRMVAQYGGKPKRLPLDHIYILKPGSVLAMTKGRLAGGICNPIELKIGVEKEKSKFLFASGVAHELFHLKSYKSARVDKSSKDVHLYRDGISMIDQKDPNEEPGEEKKYFAMLEEAIVTECTGKFLDEISKDAIFREEAEAIKKFGGWVVAFYRGGGMPEEKAKELERELKYISEAQDRVAQVLAFSDDEKERRGYAAGMFRVMCEKGKVETVERYLERKKLYELLDTLIENSGGRFKNRDEIFSEFAKAHFSGNYLSLARIVESILGKSSFRRLAEEFSKEPKKEEHGTSEKPHS